MLVIGGYHDGERAEGFDGDILRLPIPSERSAFLGPQNIEDTIETLQLETYVRMPIYTYPVGTCVWLKEGMSEQDMIRRLIDHYRPPKRGE